MFSSDLYNLSSFFSHVLPLPALVTNPPALKKKALLVFFHRTCFKQKEEKIDFSEKKKKILRSPDLRHEKKSLQDKCLKSERMYNKKYLKRKKKATYANMHIFTCIL